MQPTWEKRHRRTWRAQHWIIALAGAYHVDNFKQVPTFAKSDKIPYVSQLSLHIWILSHAMLPLAFHQLWLSFCSSPLHSISAILLYFASLNLTIIHEFHILRRLAYQFGFFDGDVHKRDGVPEARIRKVAASLFKATGLRVSMMVYGAYDALQSPSVVVISWRWWIRLAIIVSLYLIILDFFFYWYHRAMHEVDFLWKYHRTHHHTKHPNPLLAGYADFEQEIFDMAVVPLLTYGTLCIMHLPPCFYEWWICNLYVMFSEVWGHSGLRVHFSPPHPFVWILYLLGVEGGTEDHDLHHRYGWRAVGGNYSKQSRLWDRMFGTGRDRIETLETNVDYTNQVLVSLW